MNFELPIATGLENVDTSPALSVGDVDPLATSAEDEQFPLETALGMQKLHES